jgi:hypothetical protein
VLKSSQKTQDYSVIILKLIAFIVSNESHLERFQNLSGVDSEDLKNRAADQGFQHFILDYALQDESLVVEFAASEQISPKFLEIAQQSLAGPSHDF